MAKPEILLIPNLLSLSRILLTPLVGYFLWLDTGFATAICVALLVVAAITDALDGYLARRMGLTSQLGLILDPLADKVFAAVLLVELVLFRQFPVWLASVIVGRDLLIGFASLLVLGRRKVALGSTLTGRYAFFAIVMLIGFAVIRFESGVRIATVTTIALIGLTMAVYGRAFIHVLRNQEPPRYLDRPMYRGLRIGLTAILLAVCLVVYIIERI